MDEYGAFSLVYKHWWISLRNFVLFWNLIVDRASKSCLAGTEEGRENMRLEHAHSENLKVLPYWRDRKER